jgi:hypothetical protein
MHGDLRKRSPKATMVIQCDPQHTVMGVQCAARTPAMMGDGEEAADEQK